jgi:hypothetical protein
MDRSKFVRHGLTHIALERLRQLALGEEVAYAELQRLMGIDPQRDGYPYVLSARKILRRARILIYPTETQTLRRWTDAEIAEKEEALRNRRIRRQARIGQQGLEAANLNNLSPEQARLVTSGLGHLGAIQQFTSVRFTEARDRGAASNDPPPPAPGPIQE